ncbi:CD209 antigen-like protein A [Anabas testudineus]|uniref:CD209 antigen-like protein A n=1 Tax=Anabas testudineus TaxID=64144 RepID=UPI000E45444C|nr:CD209 antigen-like protein A [Anabas testudineus]
MSTEIQAAHQHQADPKIKYTRRAPESRREKIELMNIERPTASRARTADVLVTLQNDQLSVMNNELQSRYNKLRNMYNQSKLHMNHVQDEVKQLKGSIEGKFCPEGWTRFGCSCYFKSTEKKTWSESRTDCENRGSDLVTINSKEEQNFITELKVNGESWIGLRTRRTERGWKWEWVDGSPLSKQFWAAGQGHPTDWFYASCCSQQGKWTQIKHYYNHHASWICEK